VFLPHGSHVDTAVESLTHLLEFSVGSPRDSLRLEDEHVAIALVVEP
jgi:hypothetical protein